MVFCMKNKNANKSEADARVLIDRRLEFLGWENIWRETVPREYLPKLSGAKPDYVLCYAGSEKPAAIVEAKRTGVNLGNALKQGLGYAQKIGCPVVFASDGVLTLTAHVDNGEPLLINNEEVRDFLREDDLRNFISSRIWERTDVIKSSQQLISIFNASSKLLRGEGMVNIDAFAEFSQILFFKIVSEIETSKQARNLKIRWSDLENCYGSHLLESYKSALVHLDKKYPGVFSTQVEIKNPATLEKIVSRLKMYSFLEVKADIKGNAYEHFLRQYNAKKNELAQYFTPRHIVSMMVGLANPKFGERVYDPFCGTGGMLIESFRHIEKNMHSTREVDKKLLQTDSVFGVDISRSSSAAKMNMILAGDGHSNITRADSLKLPVSGEYDLVITNIPFVAADEKKFIRHCFAACAGRLNGRVCMIVPERILDHPSYTDLRLEILRDWNVKRVISLPREVFRGVTAAKTSIIYALWKGKKDKPSASYFISYLKVENDGFTLDKKRDPLPGRNDLDNVIETRYAEIGGHYADTKNHYAFKIVPKKEIDTKFGLVSLRDLVKVKTQKINITADMICREPGMTARYHKISLKDERYGYNVRVKERKLISPGDLVFSTMHTQNGLFAYSEEIFHSAGTHLVCTIDETKVDRDFLFHALDRVVPNLSMEDTTGRESYNKEDILRLKIPLPAIEVQREMVKELNLAWRNYFQAQSNMLASQESFWKKLSKD